MKFAAFASSFLCYAMALPAQAAPSELALAMQAVDPDLLVKGVSIHPLGKIQGGKRTFWIAQREWLQPPEEVAGSPHGACSLVVLERRKGRLTYLGRYSSIDCGYRLSIRKNRVVADIPKWDFNPATDSFTIDERGPRESIVFAGRKSSFEK